MPIKWSALKVSEAMDMVEEYIDQAVEPLEQARIVAQEARNIPNLPQYVGYINCITRRYGLYCLRAKDIFTSPCWETVKP